MLIERCRVSGYGDLICGLSVGDVASDGPVESQLLGINA